MLHSHHFQAAKIPLRVIILKFIYLALIIPLILKITGQCEFLQRNKLPQRTCKCGKTNIPPTPMFCTQTL